MTFSKDQLPPGSPERIEVAMHSAGALCNPDDVVLDWGEYDEDYTENQRILDIEHTDIDAIPTIEILKDPRKE